MIPTVVPSRLKLGLVTFPPFDLILEAYLDR